MSDEPHNAAPDPAIQAALARFLDHARDLQGHRTPESLPGAADPRDATLGALARLVSLAEGPVPQDDAAADARTRVELWITRIPNISELRRRLGVELGQYLTTAALDEVRRRLSRRTGRSLDEVDRMRVSDVAAARWEAAASPPPGRPAAEAKARPPGDPASRAVAAAMSLRKAGKPVSLRAACKAAGVDRNNLAANHPETVHLIEQLAEPDRDRPRGSIDRRTGSLDAWDDPDDG